jgi:hypothetical protein
LRSQRLVSALRFRVPALRCQSWSHVLRCHCAAPKPAAKLNIGPIIAAVVVCVLCGVVGFFVLRLHRERKREAKKVADQRAEEERVLAAQAAEEAAAKQREEEEEAARVAAKKVERRAASRRKKRGGEDDYAELTGSGDASSPLSASGKKGAQPLRRGAPVIATGAGSGLVTEGRFGNLNTASNDGDGTPLSQVLSLRPTGNRVVPGSLPAKSGDVVVSVLDVDAKKPDTARSDDSSTMVIVSSAAAAPMFFFHNFLAPPPAATATAAPEPKALSARSAIVSPLDTPADAAGVAVLLPVATSSESSPLVSVPAASSESAAGPEVDRDAVVSDARSPLSRLWLGALAGALSGAAPAVVGVEPVAGPVLADGVPSGGDGAPAPLPRAAGFASVAGFVTSLARATDNHRRRHRKHRHHRHHHERGAAASGKADSDAAQVDTKFGFTQLDSLSVPSVGAAVSTVPAVDGDSVAFATPSAVGNAAVTDGVEANDPAE